MSEPAGRRLGRYRLLRPLAEGGMAEVWLARPDGPTGITRVVKRILGRRAQDEHFRRMFVAEARVAMDLAHGNIAQVVDFGEVDGEYFLVMEYVRGKSLFEVLVRAAQVGLRIPYPLSVLAAQEAARGLHHAHQRLDERGHPRGIVHRDVSPQNVLLSFDGQVKVVDFGIARAAESEPMTRAGVVKGKYVYFSPEQASTGAVDHRTDVYALGVVLYQLLTGRLPAEGPVRQVIERIRRGDWARPRMIEPDLPEDLEAVVLRAMAGDPRARFQSAQELEAALTLHLRGAAPGVGTEDLGLFVRWLFPDELEGGWPTVDAAYGESLQPWIRTPAEPAALTTGVAGTVEIAGVAPPASGPRWGVAAVLGGAVILGALAGVWSRAQEVPVTPEPRRPAATPAPALTRAPARAPLEPLEVQASGAAVEPPTAFQADGQGGLMARVPAAALAVPASRLPFKWIRLDPAVGTPVHLTGSADQGGLVRRRFSRIHYFLRGEGRFASGQLTREAPLVLRGHEEAGFAVLDPLGAWDNGGDLALEIGPPGRARRVPIDATTHVVVGQDLDTAELAGLDPKQTYQATLDPGDWSFGAGDLRRVHFMYSHAPLLYWQTSGQVDDTMGVLEAGRNTRIAGTLRIRFFVPVEDTGAAVGTVTIRLTPEAP